MGTLSVIEVQHITGCHIHTQGGAKTEASVHMGRETRTHAQCLPEVHHSLQKPNLGPWGELPDVFPQEVPDEGPKLLV